jgi:endonuclease/exonuclease/phosphatase family metal-dependent hydrolase
MMTLNLRFENDRDGVNHWSFRREILVEVVKRFAPSLLGTQEGTSGQLEYLQRELPQYQIHLPYRPIDETCQYPTLFYLRERFESKEGGEFWLSRTPDIHRSNDWDSAFPRMMSYALFEDLKTNNRFWAAVTHLDHVGAEARKEQATIISEWLRTKAALPRILMGDFNDLPGSPAHRILTAEDVDLRDSWQLLGRGEDERSMTHHDFHGVPEKCRMDWILVSRGFQVLDAHIIRDHCNGRYPSDHFPYGVVLDWASV